MRGKPKEKGRGITERSGVMGGMQRKGKDRVALFSFIVFMALSVEGGLRRGVCVCYRSDAKAQQNMDGATNNRDISHKEISFFCLSVGIKSGISKAPVRSFISLFS